MTDTFDNQNISPSIEEDACAARPLAESVQSITLSCKLAYTDEAFMMREDLRAVGLQRERLKSDLVQQENEVDAIVVTFGRTRFPSSEVAQARLQNAEREALKDFPTTP